VANGFYHTLKDGSLSLSEMGSMADTAAQGSALPLQGTVATVQNIATSVQNVLAPLAAGVLGGGATHIGLHRRQNKRTRGKLGELLAAVTEQRQEITSLRDQISTAVARIDQIEEVLAAQPVPPTAAPSSGDALEAIKGIGPVFARRLREAGILTFSDLTKLSAEEIQAIVAPGRASHMFDIEDWIMQARQYAEESGQEPAGEA
jgi:predicted flap endonuclease-1-like 5' DNA nuclease